MRYAWFVGIRLRSLVAAGALTAAAAACAYSALALYAAAPARPLAGYVVAVDAGHGGGDRGACHLPSGLIEKEINLDVAQRLGRRLEELGARVIQIRTEDEFIELDRRSQTANDGAADALVSVHVNRIPGHPECYGAQTFYFPGREASQRLAHLIQEELLAIDPANYRRPLAGEYRVLRLAEMPAVIVEIGFITNERDRGLLAASEYRERVARAVAAGVARFAAEQLGDAEAAGGGGP